MSAVLSTSRRCDVCGAELEPFTGMCASCFREGLGLPEKPAPNRLAEGEAERLAELEAQVEASFDTARTALLEIRDRRLYRAAHGTFEAYLAAKWGIGRQYGYRLIGAAEVDAALSPMGDTGGPLPERQARELAPVLREKGPEVVRTTWAEVRRRHGGEPTAADVRKVAGEVLERPPPSLAAVPTPPTIPCPVCHGEGRVPAPDAA